MDSSCLPPTKRYKIDPETKIIKKCNNFPTEQQHFQSATETDIDTSVDSSLGSSISYKNNSSSMSSSSVSLPTQQQLNQNLSKPKPVQIKTKSLGAKANQILPNRKRMNNNLKLTSLILPKYIHLYSLCMYYNI